jgi:hypothetical protein
MKCRLLADELITHPDIKSWQDFHALATALNSGAITPDEYQRRSRLAVKAGTVIDHPMAHALVAMGKAEPVDEATKLAADRIMPGQGGFDLKLANAIDAYNRLESAQITGDPDLDASPEQVEAMKREREERIAKAG